MNPIRDLRKNLFGITQAELGVITGVRQATVSRWESDQLQPSLDELGRIRAEAIRRGLKWSDAYFFGGAVKRPARAVA